MSIREIQQSYKEFKENHPQERIPFSKFKLMYKLDSKTKSAKKTYNKVYQSKSYYQDKVSELRKEIKELKKAHKVEVNTLKKRKEVVWRRIVKVLRPKCDGCKKYERLLGKPIDVKGIRAAELIKLILGLRTQDSCLNDTDILLLSIGHLVEYLTIKDAIKWSGLQKTAVFNSLNNLRQLEYLSVSQVKSVTGKKDVNRYFITVKGEQELSRLLNVISRKSYNIFK